MLKRISLLAILVAALLWPLLSQATPYASSVTNNAGTIQFYLNESNATVVVTYEDGSTNASFDGIDTGTNLPAGKYSFLLNSPTHSSYAITVTKVGSGTPGLIKSTPLSGSIINPRGIDVNKNTSSPYFGRVYEVSGGGSPPGIMLLNPDLSYVYANTNARNGGITNFGSAGTGPGQSPYRISVAADDTLIVGDASTTGSAVYQIDPNVSTNSNNHLLLGPVGLTNSGVPVSSHGTIESRPLLIGSTNNGNAVLVEIDGELAPYNSIQVYNIGSGPLPWTNAPNVTGGQVGIGLDSIALGGNEYPGLTRGPNGYLYCSTYRANLSNPILQVYDSTGVTNLWNSWQPDGTAYPGGTPSGDYFLGPVAGVGGPLADSAVSADGNYIAGLNYNNGVWICSLTNGIPNPASIFTVANVGTTTAGRAIAWDAALNYYVSSSGLGVVQEWSLGVTAAAVTKGNATGQTNFSLTLPSTQVSASATTTFASQSGPTPGVFTITRNSPVSSDTNAPLIVNFNLSGTAPLATYSVSGATRLITTNLTYVTNTAILNGYNSFITTNYVIAGSVTFAAGQNSTNITITPVNDGQSRPTTTVILALNGSGGYSELSPLGGTISIQNTGPEKVFISGVVAPSMYKRLTNDYGSFYADPLG